MPDCQYCHQSFIGDQYGMCSYCGAPKPEPETIEKWEPFFYDGYIVYALHDTYFEIYHFVFYKGIEVMGHVTIGRCEMMANVKQGEEYMPYVMKKLKEVQQCLTATP